jgi:hypothetical protein
MKLIKRIYEIIDECRMCETLDEVVNVLKANDSPTLREVFKCAYHPYTQWYLSDIPDNYKKPDTLPGISRTQLYTEFRRIYLFQKGHPTADGLSPEKRKNLLTQILEGLEPDDAQVFVDVLRKDLQIQDLTPEIINKAFPNLL